MRWNCERRPGLYKYTDRYNATCEAEVSIDETGQRFT